MGVLLVARKLTPAAVRLWTLVEVAGLFGVSVATVKDIQSRRSWSHI